MAKLLPVSIVFAALASPVVVAALSVGGAGTLPPAPRPAETFGLDASIPPILASDQAAADRIAGFCSGLADRIEADGRLSEPHIGYLATILDLRLAAIDLAFDGSTIGARFPEFGPTIERAMQGAGLDDGGQSLTPELRQQAVAVFRAIAWASQQ